MLWLLYSRMCTEHGFARIIIIYVNKVEFGRKQHGHIVLASIGIGVY